MPLSNFFLYTAYHMLVVVNPRIFKLACANRRVGGQAERDFQQPLLALSCSVQVLLMLLADRLQRLTQHLNANEHKV